MSLINLFINLLSGGATGYITNDFAVKMIFKKYGPMGGVILDTREEFTENISRLVERDIINNRTIESELEKEEFRQVFIKIITDMLSRHLPEHASGIDIGNIPLIDQTFDSFFKYYQDNVSGFIEKLLHTVFNNIRLSDLVGEKQRGALSKKIFELSLVEIKNSSLIKNLLLYFYRENKERQISEFIDPQIIMAVATNLAAAADGLHEKLKLQFEPQIDLTIRSIYERLGIDAILIDLINNIKDKQLVELLGRENAQDLACEMLEQSIKLLKSSAGRQIINDFSANVIRILKGTDATVFSILDDRIESNLETYLQEKLPDLVEKIIVWIKVNKHQLEELINQSVDDVLSAEGGIQAKVKMFLKDTFINDVAKQYGVVTKIIEFIETDTDIRAMSVQFANILIAYLKENTLSHIFNDLEQKKILKPEYLTSLILNNINNHLANFNVGLVGYFLGCRLGDLINDDFEIHFTGYIREVLVENCKTKYLFAAKSTELMQGVLADNIIALAQSKLGQLINSGKFENLAGQCEQAILSGLAAHQSQLIAVITQTVEKENTNKTLGDFFNETMRKNIGNKFTGLSLSKIKEQLQKNPNLQLQELCRNLSSRQQVIEGLTNLVLELIKSNMHIILDGKIEQAVANNLEQLPDAQLQAMVEDFMGKELKPISLFGAILGTMAALGIYFVQGGLQVDAEPAINPAITVAAYGFIGYLTNVVALKMVFRPYKQWDLLGIKVPFTPGVVAKQKSRFAASMGVFVDQDLLNADAVADIFRSKRKEIEKSFSSKMQQDNYHVLHQLLNGNSDFIAGKVTSYGLAYLKNNRLIVVSRLLPELASISMSSLNYDQILSTMQEKSKSYLQGAGDFLVPYIEAFLRSPKSLNAVLPQFAKDLFFKRVNGLIAEKLQVLFDYLKDDAKIEGLVASFDGTFAALIEKNIYNLLSEQQRIYIKDTTGIYLINKMKSPEVRKSLLEWTEARLSREIAPDKSIGDLFGGFLIRVLRQNIDFILKNVIGAAEHRLQADRENIKGRINGIILDKGIWAWFASLTLNLQDTIGNIVDDLVEHKLPDFIKDKQAELEEMVNDFIDGVERTQVGEVGVNLNYNGILHVMDRLLASSSSARVVKGLSDQFVESVLHVPAKELFRIVDVSSTLDVYKLFASEIKTCRNELANTLAGHQAVLVSEMSTLFQEIIEKLFSQLPVAQFSRGIAGEDLARSVKVIIYDLTENDYFAAQSERYIRTSIGEVKVKELSEILDFNLLKKDTLVVLDRILEDDKAVAALKGVVKDAVNALASEINNIIVPETRDYIFTVLLKSTLDAVDVRFYNLVSAVNIRQVTEREINSMNPRKIEALFNSFAKPYFRKVEMYGWFGGGIGLLASIPGQLLQAFTK